MVVLKNRIDYEDLNLLRIKLACSIRTGKSLSITTAQQDLRDYELNLLKLVETLTNGTFIKFDKTAKKLNFHPGFLIGGHLSFDCDKSRGLGYYLQFLLMVVPFVKNELNLTLTGVTDDLTDPSVDYLVRSSLPIVNCFMSGNDSTIRIEVKRRGVSPNGGGVVVLNSSPTSVFKPRQLTDCGKVKRIRGISWTVKVSPAISNRIIFSARSILNKFIPDIYINTHHTKSISTEKCSPGFGVTLWAQTTSGVVYSSHSCSKPRLSDEMPVENPSTPEEVGLEAANLLICEIFRGGCTCSGNQSLVCWMMAVNQADVSRAVMSPPTSFTVGSLRLFRDFFGVVFKMERVEQDDEVEQGGTKLSYTCVGVGYTNSNKEVI